MSKPLDVVCPGCKAHIQLTRRDVKNFDAVIVAPSIPAPKPKTDPDATLLDEYFDDDSGDGSDD